MKILIASLLLVACGTAESPKLPTIEAALPTPTPTAAPTVTPTVTPTPSPEAQAQASEATSDNSEALFAAADAQWHTCIRNAVAACGRQPSSYSPAFDRCKSNNSVICGTEPVLTDFQ